MRLPRPLVFVCLAISLLLSLIPTPAKAGTDDYPYKTAAWCDPGLWCISGRWYSDWGFAYRNCTDFVAHRMNAANGVNFYNSMGGGKWGNANTWDDNARALGYRVDNTPARGAIAQTDAGTYGHVAWVDSVNSNGTVTIEEYNYAYTGTFNRRTVPASSFRYIHVKDIPTSVLNASSISWSAPNWWYAGEEITATFTVTNPTAQPLQASIIILAARDSAGRNRDQSCGQGTTIQPGGSHRCSIKMRWEQGTYQYWLDWMSPDGTWHQGQLSGSSTFTIHPKPPLSVSSALKLSMPMGPYVWAPVKESFTVKNTSSQRISVDALVLAVRDPYNDGYDQVCARNLTLAPGQTKTCTHSNGWGSTGTYRVWPAYLASQKWNDLAEPTHFSLQPAPGGIAATTNLTVTAPEGWYTGKPIVSAVSFKNTSSQPISGALLLVASRDPQGKNIDQACASNLTLAPGATKTCRLTRTLSATGTYSAFASWQDRAGVWREFGTPVKFTLKAPPPQPTSPPTKKPTPPKPPTVARTKPYTVPGEYEFNGRRWRTTCEPYSRTERCRTEIWGTKVVNTKGAWSRVNGWVFNNLTYLPSPRSLWKGNILGGFGKANYSGTQTIDGRQWRVECDTKLTGRNACRSYIRTSVGVATATGSGWAYAWKDQWVFNNIVLFS